MSDIPQDIASEQSLLGAILLRPIIMQDVISSVDASDFYKPSHQHIYAAVASMFETGYPIDAVTVADELTRQGLLEDIGGIEALVLLTSSTPAISNFARYADAVIECSRRRRVIAKLSEIVQEAYNRGNDIEDLIGKTEALSTDDLIAPRAAEIQGLFTIDEFVAAQELLDQTDGQPWLIPHLIKPRWRVILIAGEGIGKAVLMRFLGLHVACGRDPWQPRKFIDPQRVLYVDAENPAETILHQMRISNRQSDVNLLAEAGDNFHIWHREGGIDLRSRRHQAEFEKVLQKTKPAIVMIGPMYKCYTRRKNEDMEQAALEFTAVLDSIRVRYNVALMIEHHAPKASAGSTRDMNPFGSSLFLRWPELGLTLEPEGQASMNDPDYVLNIKRFRRDRVLNDWPQQIERSSRSQLAWIPFWADGRGARL